LSEGFFLYEDLADTYRDLKSGFRLLEAGRTALRQAA